MGLLINLGVVLNNQLYFTYRYLVFVAQFFFSKFHSCLTFTVEDQTAGKKNDIKYKESKTWNQTDGKTRFLSIIHQFFDYLSPVF